MHARANLTDSVRTSVLLIQNDIAEARLINQALEGAGYKTFQIKWVTQLSEAIKQLGINDFDVVLLDLSLPDCAGLDAFDRVFQIAPSALIMILSSPADEGIATQAVQRGAYDYLLKCHVNAHWLPRALRYVIESKTAQNAQRKTEARFRAMSDASPLGIFVSDATGDCVYTNAAYHKISGLTFEETLGTNWSTAIHPEDRQRVLVDWHAAALSRESFQAEARFLRDDDSIVWTRLNGAVMRDGQKSLGHVQTVEDITERKSAELILSLSEEALFEEKERAQITLNSIGDAVLTTDILGNVTYLNLAAETLTGWSRDDALGRPLIEVFNIIESDTRQAVANPAKRAIEEDKTVELTKNCVLVRRDGTESAIDDSSAPIHNREGHVIGAVIVFHDVTEERAMALKMSHLAMHDALTGLPNRVLLTERLHQAIGLARRNRKQIALMFMDLDHFKKVNDSLGHVVGDRLLQLVAKRLVACVRTTDTVCRQGGDEFVILLPEIEQPHDAAQVAAKLLDALAEPQQIDGNELHIALSIGISVFPDDGQTVDAMMIHADNAMYEAKERGRNNFRFFKNSLNAE
ncbi:MAG: diguanylate cyclase [Oxalobacter sp.]|nr:MAG: diguanylate cyclase [Oxalobacter sp.]